MFRRLITADRTYGDGRKRVISRTVELLDRNLRFLDVGVLHDAVPTAASLAAGGNVHKRDGAALGEDAAELFNGGGPRDVAHVQTVGRFLRRHCYGVCLRAVKRCRS